MEDTMLLVDQQRAHRKVLFERYTHLIEKGQGNIQQLLFPEVLELNASDFALMQSMLDDIRALGFDIEEFGGHSFQLLGIPADANVSDAEKLMEEFLEQLKNEQSALHYRGREKLAWAMASSSSIRYGQMLTLPEMKDLLQRLMACKQPQFVQGNKPVYVRITLDQIGQQFK